MAVPDVTLALTGSNRETVNSSLGSRSVSPLTLTVMVCGAEDPGGKETVPEGKTPPVKSSASAGLVPEPATDQDTKDPLAISPMRITVKVNGLGPESPSFILRLPLMAM